ncbi:hypothetical protein [Nocardioides sp.]|uniref:hypothetical protein n=1 Tax=Nocardioides sp. TaxID=35761 RepID=UPI002628AFB3|nr:hypothetical protein [Nocardioides sp.]
MRRWAGPPPLLIAVTVLGILVAPAVSHADAGPPAIEQAVLAGAEPGPTSTPTPSTTPATTPATTPGRSGGASTRDPAPDTESDVEPEEDSQPGSDATTGAAPGSRPTVPPITPQKIGVASFNQYVQLSGAAGLDDARALTSRDGVDVVGWQEGFVAGPIYQALAEDGWATRRYVRARGSRELAVSWRKDRFAFVGSALHKLADGVAEGDGRYPFGTRYALRVTLRDRATGEQLSVINTHLPQRIEDLEVPGTWRTTKNALRAARQLDRLAEIWERAPGRWVVGTGDYNIAALADQRARNSGGVVAAYAGVARSSYSLLGFEGLQPTHPYSGRFIDYVHVAQPALKKGRIEVLGQRTPGGLSSDHRPLVVRLKLS